METHSQIIARLGGIRKLASALGHTNHTTVQGWHDRNNIPVDRWGEVIQAAAQLEQPITVDELMPAELRGAA